MKRGEIYYAELNPTVGSEVAKIRPVLIISNNANNRSANTVTIIPITSNITKIYPFEVALTTHMTGLSKASKAQCQQVRTISKLRVKGKLAGQVDFRTLNQIEDALKLHLALD